MKKKASGGETVVNPSSPYGLARAWDAFAGGEHVLRLYDVGGFFVTDEGGAYRIVTHPRLSGRSNHSRHRQALERILAGSADAAQFLDLLRAEGFTVKPCGAGEPIDDRLAV